MTVEWSWAEVYREHPVPPVRARDPLEPPGGLVARYVGDAPGTAERPRIGFACWWDQPRESTLSGMPWNLRVALQAVTQVKDIGVDVRGLCRSALRAVNMRYHRGWSCSWRHSRLSDAYSEWVMARELHKVSRTGGCDAVLMIGDLGRVPLPLFLLADSSWDSQISGSVSETAYAQLRSLSVATMRRRRDRQVQLFQSTSGVIAESHWLARCLIEQSGLAADKVYVVHPGLSVGPGWGSGAEPPAARHAPRRRLLFVGRQYRPFDFYRKGGDIVVRAFEILRRDYDPLVTLTIAGVESWPLKGNPPDGVDLVGVVPRAQVAALLDSHDLLVVPSRMEPFGYIFIEALVRGVPCIGRDAYAMPEVITPGLSGALVGSYDGQELAEVIVNVLGDDGLYETCRQRAPAMAKYFSWDRAAVEIVDIIARSVSGTA